MADTLEAMSSNRPYRNGLPLDVVVRELHKYSGSQFDPNVVQALMKLLDEEGDEFVQTHQKFDIYAFLEG